MARAFYFMRGVGGSYSEQNTLLYSSLLFFYRFFKACLAKMNPFPLSSSLAWGTIG